MESLTPQKLCAGLAGAGFVVVSQILARDMLSKELLFAACVFGFVIPIDLYFYVLDDDFTPASYPRPPKRIEILHDRFLLLLAMNGVGFFAVFLHFGITAAALFLFGCLVSVYYAIGKISAFGFMRLVGAVLSSPFRALPKSESPEKG